MRNGTWKTTFSANDSIPYEIVKYKDGLLEGEYQAFFGNGDLNIEGIYKNNKRDGKWTWYYKGSKIETSVTFTEGNKEGEQIFYDDKGGIKKTEFYKNNQLIETKLN